MIKLFIDTALAQVTKNPTLKLGDNVPRDWTLEKFFGQFLEYFLAIAAIGAFLGIIYSGFMMITSGGDASKVEAGRKNLLWSVIAIILIVLSFYLVAGTFRLVTQWI